MSSNPVVAFEDGQTSSDEPLVPETRVLAIASHVVFGYVGNTMATFVMQAMGCEVAALNTVNFSNHTGYRQFKGTKVSAEHIRELYEGLKMSYLNEFDMMLSGYIPGAEAVEAVGYIARDLKLKSTTKPGAFFWVLDPVMGDNGALYGGVSDQVVGAYKKLLKDADLVLPNQFEVELLSGTKITDAETLVTAIRHVHLTYRTPHILITSIRFSPESPTLSIIGSTCRSDCSPRLFRIDVPAIDAFFSGTGDMFAALTVVRLREAAHAAGLDKVRSWISPDDVEAVDLPLAKATEQVAASMQAVLERTKKERDSYLERCVVMAHEEQSEKREHLRVTKASEVRLVRNVACLRNPEILFKARQVEADAKEDVELEPRKLTQKLEGNSGGKDAEEIGIGVRDHQTLGP